MGAKREEKLPTSQIS